MTTTVPSPLFCPVHVIHPDTAIYLGQRQSEQKNLVVMWQDLVPCTPLQPEKPYIGLKKNPFR